MTLRCFQRLGVVVESFRRSRYPLDRAVQRGQIEFWGLLPVVATADIVEFYSLWRVPME